MFERVTIWAADREASERFYGLVLRTLGTEQSRSDARDARWGVLIVRSSDESNPPTQRVHLGFTAQSRGRVDEFWRIGTGGGYRDDGQPGPSAGSSPAPRGSFSVVEGTATEHLHMAFPVDDDAVVDAFHHELTEAGYRSLDTPAERRDEQRRAYAATVADPDGNRIELVNRT